jgi:hypothetical protein
MTDPNLSYFGHPILPTGYDSAAMNADEFNGPGINEPVWPTLFDTFEAKEVLIITEDMLEVFDGCADVVIRPQNDNVVIAPFADTIVITARAG